MPTAKKKPVKKVVTKTTTKPKAVSRVTKISNYINDSSNLQIFVIVLLIVALGTVSYLFMSVTN